MRNYLLFLYRFVGIHYIYIYKRYKITIVIHWNRHMYNIIFKTFLAVNKKMKFSYKIRH